MFDCGTGQFLSPPHFSVKDQGSSEISVQGNIYGILSLRAIPDLCQCSYFCIMEHPAFEIEQLAECLKLKTVCLQNFRIDDCLTIVRDKTLQCHSNPKNASLRKGYPFNEFIHKSSEFPEVRCIVDKRNLFTAVFYNISIQVYGNYLHLFLENLNSNGNSGGFTDGIALGPSATCGFELMSFSDETPLLQLHYV